MHQNLLLFSFKIIFLYYDLKFKVEGSKLKVQSSRFKVQGSKLKDEGLRFKVQSSNQ
jgi:hypothetical protein